MSRALRNIAIIAQDEHVGALLPNSIRFLRTRADACLLANFRTLDYYSQHIRYLSRNAPEFVPRADRRAQLDSAPPEWQHV